MLIALFGPVFQQLKWSIVLFDHFISSETWKMHFDATRVITKRREWELQKHDSSLAWHLNFTKCHKWFHCNVTKCKGHLFCVENKSFSWLSKTQEGFCWNAMQRRSFKMPSDRRPEGFRKNKLNSISKQTHTALIRSIELIWLSMKLFVLCLPYLPIFRISAMSCFCRKTSKLMEVSTYQLLSFHQ